MERLLVHEWYQAYKNDIYRYALSVTKDPQRAEDVLQDTFVKALSEERHVDPERVRAWLYRVAHNLCMDALRRDKRELVQTDVIVGEENPYRYIDMIAFLSQQEQQIVTLKIVDGLTHKEIGQVLGITAKAAQKRYERAIARLRDKEDLHGA